MDVALVNRMLGLTRGGGEVWDIEVGRALAEMGVNVTFYVGKPLTGPLTAPPDDFDFVTVPTPNLRNLAYAAPRGVGGLIEEFDARVFVRQVARRLAGTSHDVVHVNSEPRFARVVADIPAPVTIKMNGPPHSMFADTLNPFVSSYDYFEAFDAVVATGVTTEAIESRVNIDVKTINPGVDTATFRPVESHSRFDDTTTTLLFVGRFVPAKNLSLLVEAFADVHGSHPDTRLVLVGDGPLRPRIETRVDELALTDAVTFEGYVDHEALPSYYSQSDMFVLTSDRESFGIVLLEAMSCGTPVVAPDMGYVPEIVDNGTTGFLYAPGSKNGLVEHLERLITSPQLRERLGDNGRERALNGFDWDQRAKALKQVFTDVTPPRC